MDSDAEPTFVCDKMEPGTVTSFRTKIKPTIKADDPLKKRKKKSKKREPPIEEPDITISPSIGTRTRYTGWTETRERKVYINPKAVIPIKPKEKKFTKPCPWTQAELDSVTQDTIIQKIEAPSAEIKAPKRGILPRKATPTPSNLEPPGVEELSQREPISGIVIREAPKPGDEDFLKLYDYDSFDRVEDKKARPFVEKYVELEKSFRQKQTEIEDPNRTSDERQVIREELTEIRNKMEVLRGEGFEETIITDLPVIPPQEEVINVTTFQPSCIEKELTQDVYDTGYISFVTTAKSTAPWLDDTTSEAKVEEITNELIETITRVEELDVSEKPAGVSKVGTKSKLQESKSKQTTQLDARTSMSSKKSTDTKTTKTKTKGKGQQKKKEQPPTIAEEGSIGQGDIFAQYEEDYQQLEDQLAGAGDMGEDEEAGAIAIETYLTKQFRKKVSQISNATSYNIRDTYVCPKNLLTDSEIFGKVNADKIVQKFCPVAEEEIPERKFARGTLQSHSFTKLKQKCLKDFCFGSKSGTMQIDDEHLYAHGKQGICTPIAAYCLAFIKHPAKWCAEDIDGILVNSSDLYEQCKTLFRIEDMREITYQELDKYCYYNDKKIKFIVDEPEFSGFTFSEDKTVFNLTKALKLFFARKCAGILVAQNVNIAVWKDKHYYLFDGVGRTKDLYISDSGVANIANFYDVESLATVLLQRSGWTNMPFSIYAMRVLKVYDRYVDYKEDDLDFDNERENYNLISEAKAVLLGSFHLSDLCFKYMRNKQAVACVMIALVYSRLTPAIAWTRTTIDKIMILGTKLCQECMKCDHSDILLIKNLPAYFALGPYIIEIYVHENLYCDSIYKRCKCQLQYVVEEFFKNCTNALLNIEKTMVGIFKQRCKYFLFDPYSRNFEGYLCRDGAACISMHTTIDSLISTILSNVDISKEIVFHIHGLKVVKIIRDPTKFKDKPKCVKMSEVTIDAFKGKMIKGRRKATQKKVRVDFSRDATCTPFQLEEEYSIYEMGRGVESLLMEEIPKFPNKKLVKDQDGPFCPQEEITIPIETEDVVVDLDSPSLSDTHVAPQVLEDSEDEEEFEFVDLCSFDLTMDEIILEPELYVGEGESVIDETRDKDVAKQPSELMAKGSKSKASKASSEFSVLSDFTKKMLEQCKQWPGGFPPILEGEGEEGEGEDIGSELDYYYTRARFIQVNQQSLDIAYIGRISEMVNTDITAGPMELQVLYPTYIRQHIDAKRKIIGCLKPDLTEPSIDPEITQSMELMKKTNFCILPDDSQLVRGGTNVFEFDYKVEYVAPFVCIMAGIVSRKYSLGSWSPEIVDYVLTYGYQLFQNSPARFDQVSKLDIPIISLGSMNFQVTVQYIFDSYMKEKMIELAIDKILLSRTNIGVLVTPSYSCTIFFKNYLYYLFDPFGNNEVGLSTGFKNEGAACILRFKTVHELVRRIMLNKKRRESRSKVEYCRFVLSAVIVKFLRPERRRGTARRQKTGLDDEMGEGGQSMMAGEEQFEGEEEEVPERSRFGYQLRNGIYVIEGTTSLVGRAEVLPNLKIDHFICLCACLLTLACPVAKWDTTKMDAILDQGTYIWEHMTDLGIYRRRVLKNILVGKNIFDVVITKMVILNKPFNINLKTGLETLISWKMSAFMVQFPGACYAVNRSDDGMFHLFDVYGPINFKKPKAAYSAAWVRCPTIEELQYRLWKYKKEEKAKKYDFYLFEVTSIRKAPKELILKHKLYCICDGKKKRKREVDKLGKPFYEDVEWLNVDPIPWSRKILEAPTRKRRGKPDNLWNYWDIEYPRDLYSMAANIHQTDPRFSPEFRAKQTLANLVTCIGMTRIYNLSEFNPAVLDSILVNGDNYLQEIVRPFEEDEEYELTMRDLKETCTIFPFQFKVEVNPVAEGTMFIMRDNKFNLYKALRYFFQYDEPRFGIIFGTGEDGCQKRHLAFGKTKPEEYFMFDCETLDEPMFIEKKGKAYMLRMRTLNRLTHVLTLTLRGGDFFIFDIIISDLKPMSEEEEEGGDGIDDVIDAGEN